ncbi:DExH-box ATP-dependent RNA helicase DExH15 chloroplastic, partial [Mucuna pruriens]
TPTSTLRAFSDAEEDEEEDYEEKDEEEDEDEDDDVIAADEYDDVLGDVSDEEAHLFSRHDRFKWQRVEKLYSKVREFNVEIINVDELASRHAILAFLRGSSVVVSAPTSSGKTLIAEAAAVAAVARGRRIFYTTPLKVLSNQKDFLQANQIKSKQTKSEGKINEVRFIYKRCYSKRFSETGSEAVALLRISYKETRKKLSNPNKLSRKEDLMHKVAGGSRFLYPPPFLALAKI